MKIVLVLIVSLFALGLNGCVSLNSKEFSSPFALMASAHHEADIAVGDKISGEANMICVPFLFFTCFGDNQFADGVAYGTSAVEGLPFIGGAASKAKQAAAYKAVKSSGADVIVAPRYEITKTDYFLFQDIRAKVIGYAGTIRGFKQVPTADLH